MASNFRAAPICPFSATLLTGSFNNAFVQDLGSQFKVTFGSFSDTKNADFL